MRSPASFCLAFLFLLTSSLPAASRESSPAQVRATDIIHEINLARQDPRSYANVIEHRRTQFSGTMFLAQGEVPLRTHEGVRALDEAIQFLLKVHPQPALALSSGMCHAAADHCRDQAAGAMGHTGSDRTNPGERMGRYGVWSQSWAENISYGQRSAREIVLALIVDDGVRGRGHRRNLFNSSFNMAGAAYGPHARFGSVCSIDFAGGYTDRAVAQMQAAPVRMF